MNDKPAIQRLKKGDISGLDELVLAYQTKAIRTAFLITHDNSLAEDVVQETFLRIYQRIRYFDETRPFEPYLLRSVVHTALNLVKKTHKEIPLSEEIDPGLVEDLIHKASNIEDQIEYIQLKQEIFAAMAKLSPRERAVIVERYYLGMSEKEMADQHTVAPGTVKWLLSTARHQMRTFLGMESDKS